MPGEIKIRRLVSSDVFVGFDCHVDPLNKFLRERAGQNQRKGLSATWLATLDDDVVGFATIVPGVVAPAPVIAANLVSRSQQPSPHFPAPVLLIARMGTQKAAVRGESPPRGVGKQLLRHVVLEAIAMRDRFGCIGVYADAKPDAVGFYERFGFVAIRSPVGSDLSTGVFVSISTLDGALDPQPAR